MPQIVYIFLTSILCLPISIALVKIWLYYYMPELSQELVHTDALGTDRINQECFKT